MTYGKGEFSVTFFDLVLGKIVSKALLSVICFWPFMLSKSAVESVHNFLFLRVLELLWITF